MCVCVYIYIYTHTHVYIAEVFHNVGGVIAYLRWSEARDSRDSEAARGRPTFFRGNHSSDTTRLVLVFFKSDEYCNTFN